MPNVFDAIEFAARAHRDTFRKSTRIPYIVHPLAVARILIECDASEEIVIAGVLHDVVEDTPVTLPEIRAQFGDNIAEMVQGLTEPPKSQAWETRKRALLDSLETAPRSVLLIEIADKLDNIRDIRANLEQLGDATWERFNRGPVQQKWYYEELAQLFLRRAQDECTESLAREFAEHVRAVFSTLET